MSYPAVTDRGFAPLTLMAREMIQPRNVHPRNTLMTATDQRFDVCRWNATNVGAKYAAKTSVMITRPMMMSIDTSFLGSEGYGVVTRGAR